MIWRPKKRKMPGGKTVWIARYKDHRGQIQIAKPAWNGGKGTFKLQRKAQRAIDEAMATPAPERASTFDGYLTRWLETRPRSERTDRTNEGRVRAVIDVELEGLRLGEWDMRDLRRRHADELVAHMLIDQGRAPGGARNILRALSAMTEDAITHELCEVNPWMGIKVREDDRRAVKRSRQLRVWTFDQMHHVAALAGQARTGTMGDAGAMNRWRATYAEPMLRTLVDCGLRAGELLALQRAGLHDGILEVRGTAWEGRIVPTSAEKNHDRDIPVAPGLAEILQAMPPRIDTPLLFATPSGRLWRYSNWHRKIWQPALDLAAIHPTPHECRHSWNTHLRAAGIDPADLADVAGHSVEVATRVYTHPLRKSFDEIRKAVG